MAKKVKKTTKKKTAAKKAVKKKTVKKAVAKKSTVKKAVKKTSKSATAKKAARKKTVIKKKTAAKKKVAASKPKPKRVSRKRKSVLGKKELGYFRQLLVEKLKEISGDVNQIESEALKTSLLDASGNLSSMPIHMADIGSDNYEQEFALGLMDSERKIVQEIFAALERMSEGVYGICEGTGEPIPTPRLEGIPWTRYCIKYAEMVEKGLVVEGERLYDEDEDDDFEDDLDSDDDLYTEEDDEDEKELFYGYDDDDEDDEM